VLEWCIRAAAHAPGIDDVWVATTLKDEDVEIEELCDHLDVSCFRGSETDVLDRFVGVASASSADVLLRLTGDCPLLDPQVIGGVARLMKNTGADFCTNVSPRTYPDGLDVQAMSKEALMAAHLEATRPLDADGVCTWIERNRSRFPAETLICPIPGLQDERWVLDTEDDLKFFEELVKALPWDHGPASLYDVLDVLDRRKDLRHINQHHICNERYTVALGEEPVYERTFKRSQTRLPAVRSRIPLAAQTFSKSFVQYPQPSPLFLSHGQGALAYDIDGNEFVDLVAGLLSVVLGHRDPDVDTAVRRQLSSGVSFSLATELEYELAATLCHLIPCAEMARFFKTGSEATSAAVRIARAVTGRVHVAMCGYHGWHDWCIGQSFIPSGPVGVPPMVQCLTTHIEPGSHILFPDKAAAIIVDCSVVTGSGWLEYLRETCDRTGAILIFDEMITGFRYTLGGAQEFYGVTPDLACFGKGMANGHPLAAVVGRKDFMQKFEPPDNAFISGTFGGEALSIAAALATIAKIERDGLIGKLALRGQQLKRIASQWLRTLTVPESITLTGDHLSYMRLTFKDQDWAALFRREMFKTGVLVASSHNVCAALTDSDILRIDKSYEHTVNYLNDAIENNGDILPDQQILGGVR
jgi:glutamate-1-semialdehyde 2,1-aminomutase/spore coat polysaccharide biosynthesis protein SpsF